MSTSEKENLSLYVDKDLKKHVEDRAWEKRMNKSEYVRTLLEKDKKSWEKKNGR